MRVEFTLTKRDLWQYYWYSWRRSARRRLLPLAALCLILPTLNFIPGYSAGARNTLAISAFSCVLIFLAQVILFVMRAVLGFRKTLKPGTTGGWFAEIGKFDFGWGASGSHGYCHHWTYFGDIIRTRSAIYFILSGNRALIVPKTAFAAPALEEKFLALAHQQWETAKTSQRYASTAEDVVWPPPPRMRD